jgi:hypothetical protein
VLKEWGEALGKLRPHPFSVADIVGSALGAWLMRGLALGRLDFLSHTGLCLNGFAFDRGLSRAVGHERMDLLAVDSPGTRLGIGGSSVTS